MRSCWPCSARAPGCADQQMNFLGCACNSTPARTVLQSADCQVEGRELLAMQRGSGIGAAPVIPGQALRVLDAAASTALTNPSLLSRSAEAF